MPFTIRLYKLARSPFEWNEGIAKNIIINAIQQIEALIVKIVIDFFAWWLVITKWFNPKIRNNKIANNEILQPLKNVTIKKIKAIGKNIKRIFFLRTANLASSVKDIEGDTTHTYEMY